MRVWALAGLLAFGATLAAAQARVETALSWPPHGSVPGGLSGLAISEGGTALLAVSDRGHLIRAGLSRDPAGRLSTISAPQITPILPPISDWPDNFYHRDAESIGQLPDGRLAIAFESLHRVTIHLPDGRFNDWIDAAPEFAELGFNSGIEAMAVTAEGMILAIPEGWPPDPTRRPVFAVPYAPGPDSWEILAWLEVTNGFDPVGLDLDAQGRLYLLERRFQLILGFTSRLRRFAISAGEISDEMQLWQSRPGQFGNLEGIAIWQRGDALMATLISDDNEQRLLRRDVLELVLPDGP